MNSNGGRTASAIDFPAVAYAIHAHDANLVGDLAYDTVVADTDAPVVLGSSQLATTGWSRVRREGLNHDDDAVVDLGRKSSEVPLRTAFKKDALLGHLGLRSDR